MIEIEYVHRERYKKASESISGRLENLVGGGVRLMPYFGCTTTMIYLAGGNSAKRKRGRRPDSTHCFSTLVCVCVLSNVRYILWGKGNFLILIPHFFAGSLYSSISAYSSDSSGWGAVERHTRKKNYLL